MCRKIFGSAEALSSRKPLASVFGSALASLSHLTDK
jgi:hypothetical protein